MKICLTADAPRLRECPDPHLTPPHLTKLHHHTHHVKSKEVIRPVYGP